MAETVEVPPGFHLFDPDGALPDFRSSRVAAFVAHWRSLRPDAGLRSGRALPARADFDPSAIRPLLPHLMILDLAGDPPRPRYRLVGTAVAEIAKFDFTGEFADGLDFQEAEEFDYGGAYRAVAAARQPGLGHSAMLAGGTAARWIEFAICPLADDGVTVNQFLALEDYESLDLLARDALLPVTRR